MTFATKLAIAKTVRAILLLALVLILASAIRTVSYHYCHGANHNAHGLYCQAVYQADYTALK